MTTRIDPLVDRIVAEYRAMPGLRLTASQAARLFGLPAQYCGALLQGLADAGRLRRTEDGRYGSAAEVSGPEMARLASVLR